MEIQTNGNGNGVDKIERYDWEPLDAPGVFMWINKDQLLIDPAYQRETSEYKSVEIAKRFKFRACVCLGVSRRDGNLYVYDGGHRLLAAKRRSDIRHLPCMVFDMDSSKDEAGAFLDTNTQRRNVSSIDTFRTRIHHEEEEAEYIDRVLHRYGLTVVKGASAPRQISTVTALFKMIKESREDFERTISISAELCQHCPVHSTLVTGLFYLSKHLDGSFTDPRIRKRILSVGADELIRAANSSGAYHNHFTPKYFAEGMLSTLNRNLKKPFRMVGE